MSHFGKALTACLGIRQNLSTVFHPQTDGLTERKNQWIEQYLHLVVGNSEEWSNLLPLARLMHNNSANSTARLAPNQRLIGRQPPFLLERADGRQNLLAVPPLRPSMNPIG